MRLQLLIAMLSLLPFAWAHDDAVLFPKDCYVSQECVASLPLWNRFVYEAWTLHDKVHFIVIILMLWTCYHFRYEVQQKIFRQPARCERFEGEKYGGERKLHKYHRYFWYANVALISVHWWEAVQGWLLASQGLKYTYDFAFSQELGITVEAFYLLTFTAWLFSCHFFKYAVGGGTSACYSCVFGGKARAKAFKTESWANEYHGMLMWLAISGMALQILVAGHL